LPATVIPALARHWRRGWAPGLALLLLSALGACAAAQVLHERRGLHGDIIVTAEPGGLRTLRFAMDGARQSVVRLGDPEHLELPYARVAMAGLALVEEPRRVLVVGLGGGSLPSFLRNRFPGTVIDIAELDADVADVARRYFGFREDARMAVHIGDGRRFIEGAPALHYDAIFLDAFGAYSVPPHLATQEFLQAVRRALAPGGVVVGNVWNRSANPVYDSMVRTYRSVFDELCILEVPGDVNRIVLALPSARGVDRAALERRARALATARGFRFDLGALAESGFVPAGRDGEAGSVLRDRPAR
jgi:spermidine synthase